MRGLTGLLLALAAWAQPPVLRRPFRIEELQTAPGFAVSVYAQVPGGPRMMAFGPDGVLYVATRGAGQIFAISGENRAAPVLSGLNGPHSVAFRGRDLYVATDDAVLRFPNGAAPAEKLASLPAGGQHTTRTLAFGPDGRLYVTAGSTCNFCVESDSRRAAMLRFEPDGSGQTLWATGLRNTVGFAWNPQSGELWGVDNGGDGLGDDTPPDELNIIRQGGDYGWPDCIGQGQAVAWGAGARPDRCKTAIGPALAFQAHSAPLGIAFYAGLAFPRAFRRDAFVTFHGSWNRNDPTGYKVVRVRAEWGRPAAVEDFLWGFLDPATRTTSGRPAGIAAGPDGALYVSDDDTGNIYRIRYTGAGRLPARQH